VQHLAEEEQTVLKLTLAHALLIAALTSGLAMLIACVACGIGTYADTGSPTPGPWWPWVCPDGGEPAPDAGCKPADARPVDACGEGTCG
jgi:hypothetical protein